MVSNYSRFHSVTTYLRRYTDERIGMVLGAPTLALIFEERHYGDLGGGLLEALGRLLAGKVRLYLYPWRNPTTGETVTAERFQVPGHLEHLYAHLRQNRIVEALSASKGVDLSVMPHDVLARLQAGDPSWEALVPGEVARVIRDRGLFGVGVGVGGGGAPTAAGSTSRS
jgi:hypothetical protein